MNKCKFCKIATTTVLKKPEYADYKSSWFEWFCLCETWIHPYNRKNDRAKEFQKWSEENWDFDNNFSCCPDITIENEKLNDGFGSDVVGRIACKLDNCKQAENQIADAIENALRTGLKQTCSFEDRNIKLDVLIDPVESIQIDPKSVKDFGPYAIDALTGLVDNPGAWLKANDIA